MTWRPLIVVLALLGATGCDGGDGPEPSRAAATPAPAPAATRPAPEREPEPAPSQLVERLLADRAEALEDGQARELKDTSAGAQRARDAAGVRAARGLGVEDVQLVAVESKVGEQRARVLAELSYRLEGASGLQVAARRMRARRTGDGWRIVSDRPVGERLFWEVAPFRATRAEHVLLLSAPGVEAGPMRAASERAYRTIRRMLPGRELPDDVLVVATADARQTEELLGPIRGIQGLAAISNVLTAQSGPALAVDRLISQRVVVPASRWNAMAPAEREMTLTHEMTHTALAGDTSGRTPSWLVESLALYVSRDDRRDELAARIAAGEPVITLSEMSGPSAILKLPNAAQGFAYAAASAAGEAIVADHGAKGLFALLDAFSDPRLPGKPGARTTDRVLRRELGISLAELERRIGLPR